MLRRTLGRTLLGLTLLALLQPALAGAATDKELQRQRGSVSYRDAGGVEHGVAGQVALPDDARAQTGRASAALLTLPDSSVVSLGENTDVVVGAFNTAVTGQNKISLNGGALKFAIRHPQGGHSNYTFNTPTSQVAVRGTDGYIIVGPQGTQVVCTACEPGDVRVTILKTGIVTALITGQVLTVLNSGAAATGAVSSIADFNSPAVNQFSNGVNPFGNSAPSADATGSASGATAGGAATGAAAGASIGAIAGGAIAVGAAISSVASPGTAASTGPAVLTVTPSSFNFNSVGQTQSFNASTAITSAVSANPSIAAVTGVAGNTLTIRSVAVGSTTISVSGGGSTGTLTVTVTGAVITPQRIHP